MTFEPIAVVGAGCVLPDATDVDMYWHNVETGRVSLSAVPEGRWRLPRSAVLGAGADRAYGDVGGYVHGFDEIFDPTGFRLPAEEVARLDPSCRWVLHAARAALGGRPVPEHSGVILGNLSFPTEGMARFAEEVWLGTRSGRANAMDRFCSALPARLATRAFGLDGGFTLDAACASALYAIKLACDRLHDGRADLMLAGGVSAADDLFIHIGFSALSALSRTGRSQPFHRDADGLVPAEGAVVLALARLSDAIAAGYPVLGVIRGIGLSNDGRAGGPLAPATAGQVRAMRLAYASAGIDPASVSLVECHATGTSVGDAVEATSMTEVFRGHGELAIGSVKANLGHLMTAAGAAGVLKVLGAMRSGIRPATPGVDDVTDALAGTPLRLLRANEPWTGDRRAAVSAFGFGGNNAHLILDEWTGAPAPEFGLTTRQEPVAIVSIGARVGDGSGTADLVHSIVTGTPRRGPMSTVDVDVDGLRTPPNDLAATHAQQLLVLAAAQEATRDIDLPDRCTVLVGMGCDAEVARYHARWRHSETISGPLTAAGVLGTMPNMVANRLNALFDIDGAGYTVSADEESGPVAVELAVRALRAGETDAAVVGAVDLSHEPVHQAALAELGHPGEPGDAAIVLVLKRLADARAHGDDVIAVLDESAAPSAAPVFDPTCLFGRPHAAVGMLSVVTAALALRHRATPAGPLLDTTAAVAGSKVHIGLSADGPPTAWLATAAPRLYVYSGTDRASTLGAAERDAESGDGPARLVVLATTREERVTRVAAARRWLTTGGVPPEGVAFRDRPTGGDVAFVYTNGSAAYPNMARELALAFPDVLAELNVRCGRLADTVGWAYTGNGPKHVLDQIWGASLVGQLHTELTRTLLGIEPAMALGYSSGESTALVALRAWRDVPELVRDISGSPVFRTGLVCPFETARRVWRRHGIDGDRWATWLVTLPAADVTTLLRDRPAVHLMAVNAPDICVIGGEAGACADLVAALPPGRSVAVPYPIAVHAPEVDAVRDEWRRLHHRPTTPVPGVRFYSGATGLPYDLDADSAADAITAQAVSTIQFAAMVEQAWSDGARVFVEHGPGSQCGGWIRRTLGDRDHVAVSMDSGAGNDVRQLCKVVAELVAAGVRVNHGALFDRLRSLAPARTPARKPLLLPAHPPAVWLLSPIPAPATMAPAPPLPPVDTPPSRTAAVARTGVRRIAELRAATSGHHRALTAGLHDFLVAHAASHRAFLAGRTAAVPTRPGPRFDRHDLERLASGRISDLFGSRFAAQDGYPRQTRMPQPPMLLADRVTGIDGVPAGMGTGTIWTETDVALDSWYLDPCGRMPAGLFVEAGQADLLLISWLGCDLHNRGERVYRLLGCELTFHGSPPKPGDTLEYEIHVDGHGQHEGIRLFFFHYDCRQNGEVVLSVRGGQAGFFTDAELAATGGVLWDPPAVAHTDGQRFGEDQVRAFADGRPWDCFGPAWTPAKAHVRTPRIDSGRMLLFRDVTDFAPDSGYLAAELPVTERDWFFDGHFKDDPCMPGTLMFEGCLQAMAFYLAALGHTLDRDGWRFEPVPGATTTFRCRGQVTPASRLLRYEVFVSDVSIVDGEPTILADVLCTADGVRAFHAAGVGLRLVPDWPLDHWRQLGPPETQRTGEPVALPALGGLRGAEPGFPPLLASAWGRQSEAFGPDHIVFDGPRRAPRLPGPPYHFISRIAAVRHAPGTGAGSTVDAEYDVPDPAWYFEQHDGRTAPFAVLMEIALQPCGWLATGVGCALRAPADVLFRNLDGTATVTGEITPATRTVATHAELDSVSTDGGLTIVSFTVTCVADGERVLELSTVFGFFPVTAFADQQGLPAGPGERAFLTAPGERIALRPAVGPMLSMVDRVTGYWPGEKSLRAELDVDPGAWYFKAHFFQDPVQPGSLGIEAMRQLLTAYLIERGADPAARFAQHGTVTWKYRGQVVPTDHRVTIEMRIREETDDSALADAWLWVDGRRIYQVTGLCLRVLPAEPGRLDVLLDETVDTWLGDHRPTWTVPALPMMSVVDLLARAAEHFSGRPVVALHDVRLRRWLPVRGRLRLRTEVADDLTVTLLAWREAATETLSRFEPVATGKAVTGVPPVRPQPWPSMPGEPEPDPYATGTLFHGNGFQHLIELTSDEAGATGVLDATPRGVPTGLLHQSLLDAATHVIPHDRLHRWSAEIPVDVAGFPHRIDTLWLFAPLPRAGRVRARARFAGFDGENRQRPVFDIELSDATGVLLTCRLVDTLVSKGAIGTADPALRRAFLRDREPAGGLGLSHTRSGETRLAPADVELFDWLPGTVTELYGLPAGPARDHLAGIAVRDHVARLAGVHPGTVAVSADLTEARAAGRMFEVDVEQRSDEVVVRDRNREEPT